MRFIISSLGYVIIFFSALLAIYDSLLSFRMWANRFHSIIDITHYFQPGLITSYRFGLRGNEILWTEVLLPLLNFPVFFLLFLLGVLFARLDPRRRWF